MPEAVARERVKDQYDPAEKPGGEDGAEFGVFPCNWLAMRAFRALRRCWRFHPSGKAVGLDRAQIESTVSLMGVAREEWPELFEQLQVVEDEVMWVWDVQG